jgi:DNA-binding response OmpR family regulator
MRILVADGEILVGLMMEAVLKEAGHRPIGPATTWAQVLGLAGTTWPDLAILDADLPGGLQAGLEVAQTLLVEHGVSSIVTTSDTASLRPLRHLLLGALPKPFTATSLLGAVGLCRAVLDHGRPIPPIPQRFEFYGLASCRAGSA